jgi:hypothetical protein
MPSRAWTIASSLVIARTAPCTSVSPRSVSHLVNQPSRQYLWGHRQRRFFRKENDRITCQLGCGGTHNRDKTCGVDDTPTLGQTLLRVGLVLPHSEDGVFASPPNALDVNLHGQIPDLLFRVQSVVVPGVHNPGVVKLCTVVKFHPVIHTMKGSGSGVIRVGGCQREGVP